MPLNILMHHLRVEELTRNKEKKIEPFEKAHVLEVKPNSRFTPNKREFKKSAIDKKKPFERAKRK